MFIAQEIYYITTGNYKHRKECYLISEVKSGFSPVRKVLTREQMESFSSNSGVNLVRLPALTVTPSQFKEYEKLIKY